MGIPESSGEQESYYLQYLVKVWVVLNPLVSRRVIISNISRVRAALGEPIISVTIAIV